MAFAQDFFQRLHSFIRKEENNVSMYNSLSHEDIIRQFYPEVYNSLPHANRIELCRALMKEVSKDLGLKRQYDINYEDKTDVNYGGYYSNCTITLTKQTMESPDYLYQTIAHELKHAQQEEIAKGIIKRDNETRKIYQSNAGYTKTTISPYQYKGEVIPEIKSDASLYISIPINERKTLYDRTDETMLIYKLQPKEAEAYEYGKIYYNKYYEQREKDGMMDKSEIQRLEYYNNTHQRELEELKKTYPEVKDFQEEIKNIIMNMYLESKGKNGTYPVSSAGLNFCVRFNAIQNYVSNNETGKKFLDPRRIIDQQKFTQHQTQQFNDSLTEKSHQQYAEVYKQMKDYVEEPPIITKDTLSISDYVMNGGTTYKTLDLDAYNSRIETRYKDWSDQSLYLAFEPNIFEFTDSNCKRDLMQEFVERCKAELGLTGDIKIIIDSYNNFEPNKNYGGKLHINPYSTNGINICKNIAYQLQKIQQQTIRDGLQPESYLWQKQNYRIQGLGKQILSTPSYNYQTQTGNHSIDSTTRYGYCTIRQPITSELTITNFYDRSNNLQYMYKLQPTERDALLYAEKKANLIVSQLMQKQNGHLDAETQKIVNELNKDSYYMARQAVMSMTGSTNIEQDIDAIVANMYNQIIGSEERLEVTSKDLEFTYMWNVTHSDFGVSVLDPRTAIDQEEELNNITKRNGGDPNRTIDQDGYDIHSEDSKELEKEVIKHIYPVSSGVSIKTVELDDPDKTLDLDATEELDKPETVFNTNDMDSIINETAQQIDETSESLEEQETDILDNEDDISL